MKPTILLLAVTLLATIFSTTAFGLTVDQDVTPAYLREHSDEFSVNLKREANGLLAFTVVRTLSEPKYLVARLRIRQQGKVIAESHTPSFAKKGDNTFHFSISPQHLADSMFELSESFAVDGVPMPGTVNYQFRIRDFIPKKLLKPAASE